MLREAGYYTAYKVKRHISRYEDFLEDCGFADWTEVNIYGSIWEGYHDDGAIAKRSCDWLSDKGKKLNENGQPFIWLSISSIPTTLCTFARIKRRALSALLWFRMQRCTESSTHLFPSPLRGMNPGIRMVDPKLISNTKKDGIPWQESLPKMSSNGAHSEITISIAFRIVITICYCCLMTNGVVFSENRFRIGISIDGPQPLHDAGGKAFLTG